MTNEGDHTMTEPNAPASRAAMPDFAALSRNDKLFLGAGFAAFIFSFIEFAHISLAGFGGDSISAWHGIGTLAGLLMLAAVVVGYLAAFSPQALTSLPAPARFVAVGLATLALICFVIRWLTLPGGNVLGHHYGYDLAWGGYVTLILNIVAIAGGVLAMRDNGDPMPWEARRSAAPPA
jgi:hypothetical protein